MSASEVWSAVWPYLATGLGVIVALFLWKQVLWLFGILIVPKGTIGVVNKKFVLVGRGRSLAEGKIIALNGEAGQQADTLAPGIYYCYWPWQYQVTYEAFVTIEQGMLGVVEATDGKPIPAGRVLGKAVECNSFQDARAFLQGGGERGPQIAIIPPGTYRINPALFKVTKEKATTIAQNTVGVVTTREGKPLATNDIAGKIIENHNSFQDGQKFVDTGGFKGLQEQVILAGLYYLNPLFVSVESKPMTEVPIGYVGVVVSYVGEEEHPGAVVPVPVVAEGSNGKVDGKPAAKDRQIRVVAKGKKGVWSMPLDPGKYPINPYTQKVENVPTTNIVLNWADAKTEAHELDKNLSTIKVRSQDGFSFNLDVSQIIHVPRENAPMVIARFGTMMNLVTQVLEPSIGNYFRNSAQESDVIEFLRKRAERQKDAKEHIEEALGDYDVQAVDTLIGDIATPPELMKTLTDRKIAEQEQTTYGVQKSAEDARQELEKSKALADTQKDVVASSRKVEIKTNEASATVAEAKGAAESKTINAKADAEVLQMVGDGQAKKTLAIGEAEAAVLEKKVKAVGQSGYVAMEVTGSLASNKIALVPQFLVSGGNGKDGNGNSLVDGFLGFMLASMATGKAPASAITAAATAVTEATEVGKGGEATALPAPTLAAPASP